MSTCGCCTWKNLETFDNIAELFKNFVWLLAAIQDAYFTIERSYNLLYHVLILFLYIKTAHKSLQRPKYTVFFLSLEKVLLYSTMDTGS